jgi:membrane protein YdbS with pleckstrin-like domain
MVTLICDRCERKLEVADDLAGRKVRCPACGDVNVVPGGMAPVAGAEGRRAFADKPSAAAPAVGGPERNILTVRKAMFRARPLLFLGLLLALIAGVGAAIYFGSVRANRGAMWAGAGAAAAAAVWLLAWKIKTFDETLEITTKRIIERTGLLSKRTTEVRHEDVRNIQVSQTFWQRLFNVGRIGISSSAQDDMEIVAVDIPRPGRIREIVDQYRPS